MPTDLQPPILSAMKQCKNPSPANIAFNDCSLKADNIFAALAGNKQSLAFQKGSTTIKIERDIVTHQLTVENVPSGGDQNIGRVLVEVQVHSDFNNAITAMANDMSKVLLAGSSPEQFFVFPSAPIADQQASLAFGNYSVQTPRSVSMTRNNVYVIFAIDGADQPADAYFTTLREMAAHFDSYLVTGSVKASQVRKASLRLASKIPSRVPAQADLTLTLVDTERLATSLSVYSTDPSVLVIKKGPTVDVESDIIQVGITSQSISDGAVSTAKIILAGAHHDNLHPVCSELAIEVGT